MRLAALIFVFSAALHAAGPVESAWIVSPKAALANEELRGVLPEVHSVTVGERFVDVRSAGLSLTYLGPFQIPLNPNLGVRQMLFRIPRVPVEGPSRIGPDVAGVFLNGVPLYNLFAEASYLGQNLWHFDTVALAARPGASHPLSLGALDRVIAESPRHSPLLGFALDGFPIYGPFGFSPEGKVQRMRSGYRLRGIHERVTWPDGTVLTPGQYGPKVNQQFPLGTFVEDYEFAGEGDLDAFNGRFAVTPEYPQGTYAYFLATDVSGRLEFPYFLAEQYRGRVASEPGVALANGAEFEAGKTARLRFNFQGVRALEIVHEKPIHLMVVSSDLQDFDHIHPQLYPGGFYEVSYTFARPGLYRLFAQYALPGEAERVETFDVTVKGAPVSRQLETSLLSAKLVAPKRVRVGEDVSFSVELSGASLQPYLGAWAHFVWLDGSMDHFIHAHPADKAGAALDPNVPHVHGVTDSAAGPPPDSVRFSTNFAQAGTYKLWAQFQVAGKPVVFPFTVQVAPAAALSKAPVTIPKDAIRVLVDQHGFTPALLKTSAGKPVLLAVERSAAPNCASQIVFPGLGLKRDLPVGETTLIELPAVDVDLAFTCGMGMYRGMVVATSAAPF